MQPIAPRRRGPAPPARDRCLDRDAVAFHAALADLVRVYQFRDRTSIGCHGISVSQCYALEALVRKGAITLNQLAATLWLDKSTASRVVDGLADAGYVRRAAHPSDGRALLLAPTRAGRALHDRIVRELVEEEKALLRDVAPEVRQAAARLVAQLARAAAARAGARGPGCEGKGS